MAFMSGYRDELEAARNRIETLEAKLVERDAALNAREAELSEQRAQLSRVRREAGTGGVSDGRSRDKTIVLAVVLSVFGLALLGGVVALVAVLRIQSSSEEIAIPPPPLIPSVQVAPDPPKVPETVAVPPNPEVSKPTEVDLIQEVVLQAKPKTKQCYEEELKRDPEASGFTSLTLEILPDGRVQRVELGSHPTISSKSFDACLKRVYSELRFPKLSTVTKTRIPLTFLPETKTEKRLGF